MGEMAEFEVFLEKDNFSIVQILSILEKVGLYPDIKEMSSFEDWEFTNELEINLESFAWQTSDIFLKSFTRMYFTVNDTWRCVVLTSLIKDIYIDVSIAIEIADLAFSPQRDVDIIQTAASEDPRVIDLYQKFTDVIDDNAGREPFQDKFIAASMAVENVVNFEGDLLATLHDEHSGSMQWVLPKHVGKDITLEKFSRTEKSNTIVFTRLHLSKNSCLD